MDIIAKSRRPPRTAGDRDFLFRESDWPPEVHVLQRNCDRRPSVAHMRTQHRFDRPTLETFLMSAEISRRMNAGSRCGVYESARGIVPSNFHLLG